jgi:hypothetical protein
VLQIIGLVPGSKGGPRPFAILRAAHRDLVERPFPTGYVV